MTLKEVGDIKRSMASLLDGNHPKISKSDGGDFATAFRSGAQMLHSDETFAHIFKHNWCVEE